MVQQKARRDGGLDGEIPKDSVRLTGSRPPVGLLRARDELIEAPDPVRIRRIDLRRRRLRPAASSKRRLVAGVVSAFLGGHAGDLNFT
jgi:hypothetical protein